MNIELGFYDGLAFVSYSLIALSYAMRDIKWLRIITIVACLVDLVVYFYIRPGQPMWVQLVMSVLFISINAYQLYVLWREQAQQAFVGEQGWLYKHVFALLTPGEFKRLHQLGSWQTLAPSQQLLHRGMAVNDVSFVVTGQLNALWDANVLNSVHPGGLVGEMSYLTGKPASSDVVAQVESRLFTLGHDVLHGLKHQHPELHIKLNYIFARDLADKLVSANRLAVSTAA